MPLLYYVDQMTLPILKFYYFETREILFCFIQSTYLGIQLYSNASVPNFGSIDDLKIHSSVIILT